MARLVRVTTVALPRARHERELHRLLRRWLPAAAHEQPDIVVLPEALNLCGHQNLPRAAQPVPNATTALVGEFAVQHRCHIWCPLLARRGRRFVNTAVLIGRDGRVVGMADKHFPTLGELDAGCLPARRPGVLPTDFGKVGAAICFDANFPEVGAALARAGAEIVFYPSMYAATRWLAHWALTHGFFVVSAYDHHSAIWDNLGRLVTETGRRFESVAFGHVPPLASATLNLDSVILHYDYNQHKVSAIQRRYGPAVEFVFCQSEAVFSLTARAPDLRVADIIREFQLETRDEYLARARRRRRQG